MGIHVIQGTVDAVGASTTNTPDRYNAVVYQYLTIRSEDGSKTMIRKVRATSDVDQYIYPGASGTFFVSKSFVWGTEIVAAQVDGQEAVSPFVLGIGGARTTGLYVSMVMQIGVWFFPTAIMAIFMPPLAVFTGLMMLRYVYMLLTYAGRMAGIRAKLRDGGFSLASVTQI